MKNKYRIDENVVTIFLNSPKYGLMGTLIDIDNLEMVDSFPNTWFPDWNRYTKSFYVVGNMPSKNGRRKKIKMHRLLTRAPIDKQVDHIDHDTLNNRMGNLRLCTQSQNLQNKLTYNNNTSGIRGVCWDKKTNKWVARVQINKKNILIGYFANIDKARVAVERARKEIMPFSQEAI